MAKKSFSLSKDQVPLGVKVHVPGNSRGIVKLIKDYIEFVSFYYADDGEKFNPPENARFLPSEQIDLEDTRDNTTYVLLRRGLKRVISMHGKLLDDGSKSKKFREPIYPRGKVKLAQVGGTFYSSYEFGQPKH